MHYWYVMASLNVKSKMSKKCEQVMSISFFRLFRVARLVKLLNKNENIRTLLWTFMKSFQVKRIEKCWDILLWCSRRCPGSCCWLPSSSSSTARWGCRWWAGSPSKTWRTPTSTGEHKIKTDLICFHRNNNFQSFTMAFLVLFRSATGEAWQEIMLDCVPG